jgi:hypothetical protein
MNSAVWNKKLSQTQEAKVFKDMTQEKQLKLLEKGITELNTLTFNLMTLIHFLTDKHSKDDIKKGKEEGKEDFKELFKGEEPKSEEVQELQEPQPKKKGRKPKQPEPEPKDEPTEQSSSKIDLIKTLLSQL